MASNPYVNKVVFGSATLVDLTGTTATADKILTGYGAFGADGAWMDGTATASSGSGVVWQDAQGYIHLSDEGDIELQTKSVTPSESSQLVRPDSGYYALSSVSVGAISSTYVGSGITRRTSSDLTASGATVTVPAGYYSAQATKSVATTTHANPTASVNTSTGLVTASHTQTAGYVTAGTTTGTLQLTTQAAKTITPSTSQQTAVAANRYTTGAVTVAAMPTGTAGTPTATKGTVANHSVSVTPSVTNSTGYITGGTKTGTAVTVSASELVSGSQTITENGTGIDVTNLASINVDVSGGASNVATGTFTTISERGANGSFSIDYSGDGFPISLSVRVDTDETSWISLVSDYDVGQFSAIKCTSEEPSWTTAADTNNCAGVVLAFRYNSSSANYQGKTNAATFIGSQYVPAYIEGCIKFSGSGTTVIYKTGKNGTNYTGLSPDTTYRYTVVYSS